MTALGRLPDQAAFQLLHDIAYADKRACVVFTKSAEVYLLLYAFDKPVQNLNRNAAFPITEGDVQARQLFQFVLFAVLQCLIDLPRINTGSQCFFCLA